MKSFKNPSFVAVLLLISICANAQKKTQNITVSRVVPASVEAVWKVVGEDFGAIANSHPKIVSSRNLQGSIKYGEGAERVCNFNEKGSKYVQEKQVEFDPINHRFKSQVFHAGGIPLDPEYNAAVYSVSPLQDGQCVLKIELTLRTNPALMGSIFKSKFKKTMEDYTIAVAHNVLTGESVNKDNFKSIKKLYTSN